MKAEIVPNVKYQNEEFTISKFQYNLQFFPYYNARFNAMAESLRKRATEFWPTTPIHDMSDLAENEEDEEDEMINGSQRDSQRESQRSPIDLEILQGKEVVVLGTVFKKMPNQPNILKDVDAERKLLFLKPDEEVSNFISSEDRMYLQAGNETIELKGEELKMDELCTGTCVAVKGHINQHGSGFIVDGICHAAISDIERPLQAPDYYVAIVSGLGFSMNMGKDAALTRSMNLLFDILSGRDTTNILGDKKIVNLIIAGNCIGKNAREEEKDANEEDKLTPLWNKKIQSFTVDAVKLLDKFLCSIGQFVPVDIMPGVLDPCNFLWPQQPLHPCLFPNAYRLNTVLSVTNPHKANYHGVNFLGTSGQNIDTIRTCTSFSESVDIMRNLMEWGHIAPTCPDILPSYPYPSKDPFVLNSYPDVFFAGNQPQFSAASFESPAGKKVQLLSVPVFEDTHTLALVNLSTLKCEMLSCENAN